MMILLLLLVGPTFSFTMNEIEAKKQLEVRDPRFQNPVVGFPHQTACRLTQRFFPCRRTRSQSLLIRNASRLKAAPSLERP